MLKKKNARVGKRRRGKPISNLLLLDKSKAMSATVANRNGPNDVTDSREPEIRAIPLPCTLLKLFLLRVSNHE